MTNIGYGLCSWSFLIAWSAMLVLVLLLVLSFLFPPRREKTSTSTSTSRSTSMAEVDPRNPKNSEQTRRERAVRRNGAGASRAVALA